MTDLATLKQEAARFTIASLVAKFIGSGPHITQGSPLQNVAKISAPVLMFHGSRDANVAITHSQRMDKALRAAGKRSDFTALPGLEHSLDDGAARTRMLERIGSFLSAEIGE